MGKKPTDSVYRTLLVKLNVVTFEARKCVRCVGKQMCGAMTSLASIVNYDADLFVR